MLDNVVRFDMKKAPKRQKLRFIGYLKALPVLLSHHGKITKSNMKGIKPPYLLLANHNALMDVDILNLATFPHRINYVIAIDGFIGREKLLRNVGGICKRKFTNDINLIRHLKKVKDNGDIIQIFAEARYSLCGTNAIIPSSLAKLAKLLDVPVVMLMMKGHHINSPYWNLHNRKIKGIRAELKCILTKDQLETLPLEEIDEIIQENYIYDEYKWQKDNKIRVKYKGRAEGLHKVLYQCPHCHTEYEMDSKDNILFCKHCNKKWEYSEYGELKAMEGETEFSHIPDWYEWERENVKKEVRAGKYRFESIVHVDALPNADKFIHLGQGKLIHDENGFHLEGYYKENDEHYSLDIPPLDTYSVHIEYEYLGKYGDCVDLNTLKDTLYIYPECEKFAVTKISLATEELYKYKLEQKQ